MPDPVGPSTHWMADTLQAVEKRFVGELQLSGLLMDILGFMNKFPHTFSCHSSKLGRVGTLYR